MIQHMVDRQRYFVLHLDERDYKPTPDVKYSVQILDSDGSTLVSGYFSDHETQLSVGGRVVPEKVLEAARKQPKGKGQYVNALGEYDGPF